MTTRRGWGIYSCGRNIISLTSEGFSLSSGLILRVPTGDEGNFQGVGDPTLTPFISLTQEYGPVDIHANGRDRNQF